MCTWGLPRLLGTRLTEVLWKLEHLGGVKGKRRMNERQMRTVIRGNRPIWRRVTSRVPLGSVVAPIMFTISIIDLGSNIIMSQVRRK